VCMQYGTGPGWRWLGIVGYDDVCQSLWEGITAKKDKAETVGICM